MSRFRNRRLAAMGAGCTLGAAAVLAGAPAAVQAQCGPQWLRGQTTGALSLGLQSPVVRTMVLCDPDGPGPMGETLVVGGRFSSAGGTTLNSVAYWNGTGWSPLGGGVTQSGTPGNVSSILVLPNGDLLVGGMFTVAGGVPVNNIARWDGENWHPLAGGIPLVDVVLNGVRAIVQSPTGDVVVGGAFTIPGDNPAHQIARWDGENWWPMGGFLPHGQSWTSAVFALALMPNGDIIAAGQFRIGSTSWHIARWDGTEWHPLGAGTSAFVTALMVTPDGDLIAGGEFSTAGGVSALRVAMWNGVEWSPFGAGLPGTVRALIPDGDTDFIAGGLFTGGLRRWNGSSWSSFGSGTPGGVFALLPGPDGDILVGGSFTTAGGRASPAWARWVQSAAPRLFSHPEDVETVEGEVVTLTAVPLFGLAERSAGLAYQWLRNGEPVSNGPGGGSAGGGEVTGAAGLLATTAPITLAITGVARSDAGEYSVVLTSDCGQVVSEPAMLLVVGPCPADWNGDGHVNAGDISAFMSSWIASVHGGTLVADFNADGVVDSRDIRDFMTAWRHALRHGC